MTPAPRSAIVAGLLLAAVALGAGGCLLVRTTEHRIRVKADGSGDAVLRLIDIRSDAAGDSALRVDFQHLMQAATDTSVRQFERRGRKIISRQLFVHGDTLSAEVTYAFPSLDALEGLRVSHDEISIIVPDGRELLRTNGAVKEWSSGAQRVVWDRSVQRLFYVIRERTLPPSITLAPLYRSKR